LVNSKVETHGAEAYPYFKPFSIGEMSDKCLSTRTVILRVVPIRLY